MTGEEGGICRIGFPESDHTEKERPGWIAPRKNSTAAQVVIPPKT